MGSVQFQIVPCSSLYLFSKSIGPLQCTVNVNYRVLICCTSHFQSSSFFLFVLASSVCKPLQCLISTLTQGGKGGHLFRPTSSVVRWEGRGTANKYHRCVWRRGECLHCMDHTGFVTAQGGMCFLGLHCSGSMVFYQGTIPSELCIISCTSQV